MPTDESGRTGHEDLHVCSKTIEWSFFAGAATRQRFLTPAPPLPPVNGIEVHHGEI
jgi:hypothetical protein